MAKKKTSLRQKVKEKRKQRETKARKAKQPAAKPGAKRSPKKHAARPTFVVDPKLTDAHGKKLEYFGDYDYDDAPDNDNCDWSNPWQVVVLPPATRTPPTKVRVRYVASGTDNEVGVVDPDRLVRRFVIHPVGTAVDVRADKVLKNGDKKKSEQMVIVGWDEDAGTYLVDWEGSVSDAEEGDSVWVTLDEIEGKVVKTFSDGFVEVKLADDWVVKFRNSEVLVLWPDKAHIVDQSFVRRRVSRACSRAVAGQTNPTWFVKDGDPSVANPDWFYSCVYRRRFYPKEKVAREKASGARPSLELMGEEEYYAHPSTKAKQAWRDAHPDYDKERWKTYERPVCPHCDSGLLKTNCFCGGPGTGNSRASNVARRALRLALDAEVGGDMSEVTGFTPAQASQIMAAAVPDDVPLADLMRKKLVRSWTKGRKVTVLDNEHIKPIALLKKQELKDLADPVPAMVDGEPNDALRLVSRIEGLQFMIFRENDWKFTKYPLSTRQDHETYIRCFYPKRELSKPVLERKYYAFKTVLRNVEEWAAARGEWRPIGAREGSHSPAVVQALLAE